MDCLLHAVTKSVSFRHLQACHSHWAPCHLPQVLCLFLRWASCISQVLVQPHIGHPTLQALFHLGARAPLHKLAQPPNCISTLGLILSPSSDPIPHRLVSRIQVGEFIEMAGSAGRQHFSSQPTGRFPLPHLAIYPCPSPPKAERFPPSVLGCSVFVLILLF